MKKNRASKTAEATSAIRAAHTLYAAEPKVIRDPAAFDLLSPKWQLLLGHRLLFKLVMQFVKTRAGVFGCVLGRSRFTEDHLREAMSRGVGHYIILGAGFDGFAYRQEFKNVLEIYEIDHPATQQVKLARIKARKISVGKNVQFIPIDFANDSLKEKFPRVKAPVFISWLGVTPYLKIPVIEQVFRDLNEVCAPGSLITFDFLDRASFCGEIHPAVQQMREYARKRGEPIITGFDPNELPTFLENLGWSLLEWMPPEAQDSKYFADRTDNLRATKHVHFALAERQ